MKFGIWIINWVFFVNFVTVTAAWSAYDRVVSWSDMSDLDLSAVLKSGYASPSNMYDAALGRSALEVALTDADRKIDPEFRIPENFRTPVEFWLKIYTQYSTQQVVLFDSRHPDIIYEVLDFRELARTARNAVVYEILREKRINAAIKAYDTAFDRLASKRRRGAPLPEEAKILSAIRSSKHKHSFRELKDNLRGQTGQRDNVIKGLLAAEAYFPRMERIFSSLGVPPALTRLSLVESSFDLRAYSRSGAVGVWQFMPAPGKKLLLIDEKASIDERLSPLKSSVAAAKLLRENFVQFRSWALTVTSYNHGLRGLMKYRRSKQDRKFRELAYLFEPCNKKSPLGWAGRNYYAEFLAMLHAETYRDLFYGEVPTVAIEAVAFRQLTQSKTAMAFALDNGISLQRLRAANPDIRNVNAKLPRGYWIAVPGGTDDLVGLTLKRPAKSVSVFKSVPRKPPRRA